MIRYSFFSRLACFPRSEIIPYDDIFLLDSLTYVSTTIFSLSYKKKFLWTILNDPRNFMSNGAFSIFSMLLSRIALILLGAGTLSALDRIVSVDSKIVFVSLVPLFSVTFHVQKIGQQNKMAFLKCYHFCRVRLVFKLVYFYKIYFIVVQLLF